MNKTTQAIHDKGYTLTEFLDIKHNISAKRDTLTLRTYRRWEDPKNASNGKLIRLIEELPSKEGK